MTDDWLGDIKNWLDDETPLADRIRRARKQEDAGYIPTDDGVVYRAIRCTLCKSKQVRVYSTNKVGRVTVRYHLCDECGHHFKSTEE